MQKYKIVTFPCLLKQKFNNGKVESRNGECNIKK